MERVIDIVSVWFCISNNSKRVPHQSNIMSSLSLTKPFRNVSRKDFSELTVSPEQAPAVTSLHGGDPRLAT